MQFIIAHCSIKIFRVKLLMININCGASTVAYMQILSAAIVNIVPNVPNEVIIEQ